MGQWESVFPLLVRRLMEFSYNPNAEAADPHMVEVLVSISEMFLEVENNLVVE